jgi:hypothetical protein
MAKPESHSTVPATASTNQADRRKSPEVPKVPCNRCGQWESRVKDGRAVEDGYRRKRACLTCGAVFFTIERAA